MTDTFSSLDKQIAEVEENLRLIAERKAAFPQAEINLGLGNDLPTIAFDVINKAERALPHEYRRRIFRISLLRRQLQPDGLHHMGDPAYGPAQFNQGIPMPAIVQLLKDEGKDGEIDQ